MRRDENRIYFNEYADCEIIYGNCNHAFPIHIHKTLCIGLITSGQALFSLKGHNDVFLSAGNYYVIPPYTPHTLSSVAFERFSYSVICFKNYNTEKQFNNAVLAAKNYIEASTSNFCIDALSQAVHISKYHLNRVFKEHVGITPYQFYIADRLKKVRHGLQSGLPLSDIIFNLHYFDQSHLCHMFKKHIGISPTQYVHSYQYHYNNAGENLARIYKPFSPAVTE